MDKHTKRWLEYYPSHQHRRRVAALERFRKVVNQEPAVLLEQARRRLSEGQDPEELEDALRKYYNSLIEANRAKSSAAQYYAVVRSYFTRNYVSLPRFPAGMDVQPVYETTDILSQQEVKRMVRSRKSTRDKLVIAFLAQTGQRIGVLLAMKREMIKKRGPYGLVEVPGGRSFQNPKGHYKFIIGKDTMQLIQRLPKCDGRWLLDISKRQIARIVNEAAAHIGVQENIQTKVSGRSLHRVHPDVFCKYWKRQMRLAEIRDSDLLGFLTGHKLPHGVACTEFPDQVVLKAYKKAERKLEVL